MHPETTLTSDRPDDDPPPFDRYDLRYNAVAFYMQLLAAHDQSVMYGRPLLTEAGVKQLQKLLQEERAGRYAAADPAPEDDTGIDRPWWDGRALRLGGEVLKWFKQPAPHQTAILDAFEARGWPAGRIPDPIPPEPGDRPGAARVRLYETVGNLNRDLHPGTIRFHVDGDTVWWEDIRPGE